MSPLNFETPMRGGLSLVAVWSIVVNILALMAFNRLNLAPDTCMEWIYAQTVAPVQQDWNIIDLHNRWDSYWYLDIAKNGYCLHGETDISNVVSFPIYLIGAGIRSTVGRSAWLFGSTLLLALSIICFVNPYWAD